MWAMLVALAWAGLSSGYPLGAKRYGGLVPVGPRLYYEPESLDLYYPGDVQSAYRTYTPTQYVYDYLPYSYYPDEGYQEDDGNDRVATEDKEEDWNRDRTSKVFLQNLILAQMYQDALDKLYGYYPTREEDSSYVYGERIDSPLKQNGRDQDDEVEQLKSLEEANKKKSSAFREEMSRRRSLYPTNKWSDKRADKGQDEEILARPAVPRPSPPAHRVYQPSPYDSVKKLLQMQDKLEQVTF